MTGDKPLPIPPPLVPLAKLAWWLQEMYGLTESEMRDLLVDLRSIPLPFRLLDGSPEEKTPLESWEDLEVENDDWWAGRARWKQCPGSSYFPLAVMWGAVTPAVDRLRKRQERLALQAGVPPAAATTAMAVVGGSQGEPLQAVLDRAIREAVTALDRAMREAARGSKLPAPSLPPVPPLPALLCPAEWTLTNLVKRWPTKWPEGQEDGPPHWVFREEQRAALRYATDRVARHAVVEFLDRWADGDLLLLGRRADGVWEPVASNLRHSHFILLDVRNGLLVPVPGQASPADLQRYSELTVCPVERREPPQLVRPAPEAPPTAPAEAAVEVSPPPSKELQEAANEEIDAMLRRLWEQRGNPKRGLSRDKEALKQWKQALAEQGLTSTWGMVRARYSHADNKCLRGPPGR